MSTCLDILNNNADISSLNHTLIVLIPKVKSPETPKDFKPISLCNVICRVISKAIANRLKTLLDRIIFPYQSAFIPNRLITNNAMITFETFHFMRKKKTGRKGFLALKLDMSNAYDRVEWVFLRDMCIKLGFCEKRINLILNCVTTVSYSIIVNGKPTEKFTPQRGLRQGDPISPYLFLICAEGFSALIKQAESRGELTGIKMAKTAPQISHLFFADDSVLFFKANQVELNKVKEIIAVYEAASGQRVNLDKSELVASGNIPDETRDAMGIQSGARTVESYSKYLGLPTLIGRSKSQVFQIIFEKMMTRIKGWKETFLSKARREILIKSVIQVIPSFAMSCFLFSKSLCEEFEKAAARFYWGSRGEERKIHWASWAKLSRSKASGGLGFREIFYFNMAMVAKQLWRVMRNPHSLVARILKARYYPRGSIEQATTGFQPSYLWRSMINSRPVIQEGSAWRVGDGNLIGSFTDKWVGTQSLSCPQVHPGRRDEFQKVANFIDRDRAEWIEDRVRECFTKEDADTILAMPISSRLPPDK